MFVVRYLQSTFKTQLVYSGINLAMHLNLVLFLYPLRVVNIVLCAYVLYSAAEIWLVINKGLFFIPMCCCSGWGVEDGLQYYMHFVCGLVYKATR